MAAEETTRWSEVEESTQVLNATLNGSLVSSKEVGSSSDDSSSDNPTFVVVVRCFVVAFGVVGFIMNAFVLRVFVSRKLKKNTSNTFLTNQIIMDTLSSFLLIIVYTYKLAAVKVYYEGPGGFAKCILLNGDSLVFAVQVGSIASLVMIAAERCFKIVLPVLHKRVYKDWMTKVGIAFVWIDGILMNISVLFTSRAIDGQCVMFEFWPTPASSYKSGMFIISWQFFIPLFLLITFYGSILVVVRKSSKRVFQDNHTNEGTMNALQKNTKRSEMNIVYTMFAVSTSFAVSWFPNQTFVVLSKIGIIQSNSTFYYSSVLLIFFNTCLNPFIYASRHEVIKENMRRMFSKKESDGATTKTTQVSTVN